MNLLSKALLANAVFSLTSAIVFFLAPAWVADQIGLKGVGPIYGVAAGLMLFSAYLFFVVKTRRFQSSEIIPIIVGDLIWVVLSVILGFKFMNQFSTAGVYLVFGVAVVVFCLADMQGFGLLKYRRTNQPT